MAKNTPEGAKMKWKFGSKIDATTVLSEKKTKKGNEEKAKSKEVETEKINLLADDYVFPEKRRRKRLRRLLQQLQKPRNPRRHLLIRTG